MAEKSFGLKQINMIGVGTPAIESSSDLIFSTNGNERVRILSGGDVGIGTTQPRAYLEVAGLSAPHLIVGHQGANAVQRQSRMSFGFSDGEGSCIQSTRPADGTTENCDITFRTGGTTGQHERLGIGTDGNVSITNGNLVFSTSGTGIDFSATTDTSGMTSELLDDYEEGTFDPIYRGGTTDGTPSYVTRVGRYIKIGQLVHLTIIVSGTISGASGQLEFGGMPFVPAQDAVGTFQANNAGSYASNVGQYSAYIGSGTNYMTFRGTKTDATAHDNLSVRDVTYMRASITFRVS